MKCLIPLFLFCLVATFSKASADCGQPASVSLQGKPHVQPCKQVHKVRCVPSKTRRCPVKPKEPLPSKSGVQKVKPCKSTLPKSCKTDKSGKRCGKPDGRLKKKLHEKLIKRKHGHSKRSEKHRKRSSKGHLKGKHEKHGKHPHTKSSGKHKKRSSKGHLKESIRHGKHKRHRHNKSSEEDNKSSEEDSKSSEEHKKRSAKGSLKGKHVKHGKHGHGGKHVKHGKHRDSKTEQHGKKKRCGSKGFKNCVHKKTKPCKSKNSKE